MLISFLFLHENICCGYSLEAPRRGASNEYPQRMFLWRNKKNIMSIPPLICSYVHRWSCGQSKESHPRSSPKISISAKITKKMIIRTFKGLSKTIADNILNFFYDFFKEKKMMMVWCFMSLSTLFKSNQDDRRVIIKGSAQWCCKIMTWGVPPAGYELVNKWPEVRRANHSAIQTLLRENKTAF